MFWKRKKIKNNLYKCPKCNKVHQELPALGFDEPHHYGLLSDEEKKSIAEISSDFCIIHHPEQTDRFIRTYLKMHINDACQDFEYGIWVSVSKKTFNEYSEDFDLQKGGKSYFGRISNEIQDYSESTIGLHVNIETQSNGIRPEVIPYKSDHMLVQEWEQGITIEEVRKRIDRLTGG